MSVLHTRHYTHTLSLSLSLFLSLKIKQGLNQIYILTDSNWRAYLINQYLKYKSCLYSFVLLES